MKKRFQLTVGPEAQKLVQKLARKYELETKGEWTSVDVLECALGHGLRTMARAAKQEVTPLFTVRR